MLLRLKKKKSVSRSGGAAIVWEVVVAGSCVLFRSLDLPLSQALHHPGYVTAALIPTEKSIDRSLLCKLSYFADLIQDSAGASSP